MSSQICKASAIDPARLRTSKGALPSMAFTVSGQESVIQKWANPLLDSPKSKISKMQIKMPQLFTWIKVGYRVNSFFHIPLLTRRNRSQDCLGNTPWVTYALTFTAPWAARTFWEAEESNSVKMCIRPFYNSQINWDVIAQLQELAQQNGNIVQIKNFPGLIQWEKRNGNKSPFFFKLANNVMPWNSSARK